MASKTSKNKREIKPAPVTTKGVLPVEDKLLKEFMAAFYQQVPAEDLVGWKAEELSQAARSICSFASERKVGERKIRVFNPEQKRDGWQVPHSIVQIVNDDMPFLVDSVSAELAARGLNIEVLFHPILNVVRSKTGKLESINHKKNKEVGRAAESCIYIQIEQLLTPESSTSLEDALHQVLDDVAASTSDWRRMVSKMDEVIADTTNLSLVHDKADFHEAQDFLTYLKNNNYTFLGYRRYTISEQKARVYSEPVAGSDLGLLKNYPDLQFGQGIEAPEVKALVSSQWPVMTSKLIDKYSTVHRRVPLDAISIKTVDKNGQVTGMHLFVGLFTSSTYSCRTSEVPIVREKVRETILRAGFSKGSHDHKALEHILEKMPRDELFQVSTEELYGLTLGILRLQEKHRIALFTHLDPMRQYMSCLVYVPRDRYNTSFRKQAAVLLERAVKGQVTNFFTTLDDSPMARLLYTVRLNKAGAATYNHAELEQSLIELGREWDERLKHVLVQAYGKLRGNELVYTYGRAFNSAYHQSIEIKNALHDIRHLEELRHEDKKICVDLYRLHTMAADEFRLKVYHRDSPVHLSSILPVLENMGFQCLTEMPFEVTPQGMNGSVWIHDFALKGAADIQMEAVKENFEETFLQVWQGRAENDGLNQLVLRANLNWREVMMMRTYSNYMRQARYPYSRSYTEQVLASYPHIIKEIVSLFKTLHDPANRTRADVRAADISARIFEHLQQVQKLDHDRILRNFKLLIEKTLRTSFFQKDERGQPKSSLAMKLDSNNIPDIPLPRPHVEIYVYSSRVEAVHLRGGEIARGGIRWSDRHDDFRTEILGLMKSQMVKNTVIVPVGAKGGFIVKQPPKTGGREAYQAEGIECYKIFVQALLDLTDNNVKGKIVRPKDVVCHDGIDPYLVVAADKGTATFSDIANSLSLKAGFWLGDAFASGGSAGYDHKKVGITARGGWESVKRHFRELGKDIQKEPFTSIGVGDMAGDVFGNGVLLSKQMKLVGAFNHVHIFCDPEPDAEKSFAERMRLFKERGGWDAYDKTKLSAGGAIFERSAKTLKISSQIRKRFGIDTDTVTPDELIRTILKADVELIWFGGIGTFIKSSKQNQSDADDKSNDALRVDAKDIRAKVIGEGANLGVTQLARVEYARNGGRINTDFIDNSGGVDCSDHEVNIKILLSDVVTKGGLTLPARNKLLEQMTNDVADLVLRDNYQQTQSLSFQQFKSREEAGMHAALIAEMEKSGIFKRALEGLPDDEAMARLLREGEGLTRPELSIVMSWVKIFLFNQTVASTIPDDAIQEGHLFEYFPKALHKYAKEIRNHKLKREIIATQIVNTIVNRMGSTFVYSRMAKTGASAEEVIKAFMIVSDIYGLPKVWAAIEAMDNKVKSDVQMVAFNEVFLVAKRAVTWFLRFGTGKLDMSSVVAEFKPGVELLWKSIEKISSQHVSFALHNSERQLSEWGVPRSLSADIAVLKLLVSAPDIVDIARKTKVDEKTIASAYFTVGQKMNLDWMREKVTQILPANSWQSRVIGSLTDDFYIHQASLTSAVVKSMRKPAGDVQKATEAWLDHRKGMAIKIEQIVTEMKTYPKVSLEMLVLSSQRLGQFVHQVED